MKKKYWNWQKDDWPKFVYDRDIVDEIEQCYARVSGISIGLMAGINDNDRERLTIELITTEGLKTSEIEGEILDRESLQSSIMNNFQEDVGGFRGEPKERGVAMMMSELYGAFHLPLTKTMLCSWQNKLMEGQGNTSLRGKYRVDDMYIGSATFGSDKKYFVAPSPASVPAEMADFIKWFNKTAPGKRGSLSPITRASLAHLYFVSIHPFADGNGRVSRALVEKCLAQEVGQPSFVALSSTIMGKRNDYYTALERQNKTNEVTPWIEYFGNIIISAQKETIQQVEFTIAKARFYEKYDTLLNERQKKVVTRIFKEGVKGWVGGLSAKNYSSINKWESSATITRDLTGLVKVGAFIKTGEKKGTRYHLDLSPFKVFHGDGSSYRA